MVTSPQAHDDHVAEKKFKYNIVITVYFNFIKKKRTD